MFGESTHKKEVTSSQFSNWSIQLLSTCGSSSSISFAGDVGGKERCSQCHMFRRASIVSEAATSVALGSSLGGSRGSEHPLDRR